MRIPTAGAYSCYIFAGILLYSNCYALTGQKRPVDLDRVARFMQKMNTLVGNHLPPHEWNDDEARAIIEEEKLTDEEFLEVQKRIDKEIDLELYENNPPLDDTSGLRKFMIFEVAMNYPLKQWEMQYAAKEDLVTAQIVPLVRNPGMSDALRSQWLDQLRHYLKEIHNEKLSFSTTNRTFVSQTLFDIFSSTTSGRLSRIAAAQGWIASERREEKKAVV